MHTPTIVSNDKLRRWKLTAVWITTHLSYRPHYLKSIL